MFSLMQNASSNSFSQMKKAPTAKISIIGTPAVGKTTLTKLLSGKIISGKYIPTQGFDLGNVKLDGLNVKLWDFGGQKAYIKQHLSQYIYGSDIVIVVTDSTPKNVLTTKELLDFTKELVEDSCEIIALANKQDLAGHMEPNRVQNVLQIPTFPMVAIDNANYSNMIGLIDTLMRRVQEKKAQ
jgi:small GTP-binding protein